MDALILAGGENRRLPFVKGFLEISNNTIIGSILHVLRGLFDRVIISTNNPELFFSVESRMTGDLLKFRGPMTGILSGMISIDRPALFVAACDMPFLKYELIRCIRDTWMQMEKNSQKGTGDILRPLPVKGQDALIPCFDGRPQPLLGIYSKSIVEKLESSVRQGSRSLRHFLNELNVHYINEDVVRAIDPEGRSFVNINTLEDYQRERVAVGC